MSTLRRIGLIALATLASLRANITHAQTSPNPVAPTTPAAGTGMTFATWTNSLVTFVDHFIVPLFYFAAFFFFLWGMFLYFFTGGAENREKGKPFIFWGLVGLVAIFSIWGVVHLLLSLIPGGVQ